LLSIMPVVAGAIATMQGADSVSSSLSLGS
jgi:hypothetical protein